jgi:HEAT repeat protein
VNKKVSRLIHTLRETEDLGIRREALIALGYEVNEAIYPVLLEFLDAPNNAIRHAAVISLGRYGNPDAIEQLAKPKILHSKVVNIRWAAVAAIGKLGDFRVIDHLLKVVNDPEWIVRNQAVTEIKEKIREIIQRNDHKYARFLIRLLTLDHSEIVELAVEGLAELGEQNVDLLLDALDSTSHLVRKNAARALGQIKTRRAVPQLISLLKDDHWQVRRRAAEALGEIRDKRAVEPLVQCVGDSSEGVQQKAVRALVGFGKLSTIPLLKNLAHEKNKFALRAILYTLGEVGDDKAVPALIDHLRSSYFVVRTVAVKALVKYGPKIIDLLIPTLVANRSNIRPLLNDASNHKHPPLQLRAVRALGGLEDHRAVPLLKELVDEGLPDVQDAAVQALIQIGCGAWGRCCALIVLSQIGDESLVPHFLSCLDDDSDNVRLEAVRALRRVDGSAAVEPLIHAARKDRDFYIRFEAMRLLRQIGVGHAEVLELALSALQDRSREVRSQAARLLGNFQNPKSIQPLLKATADSHWSVRESAENGLINFGNKAVPELIGALSSKSWWTRFRVARLLGEIGDPRAIEPLETIMKKKGERKKVKEVVQESLHKLKIKQAA